MAQVDHSVNGATTSSDISTTEVTVTTHNEELSENLYRLVILGEQQKEIAEENTTATKEQLGHLRDSLDDIKDTLIENNNSRMMILTEQQLEISKQSTNATKEQLEAIHKSLIEAQNTNIVKENSSDRKKDISLAESQLDEINHTMKLMLFILEKQYISQEESQDLAKRAASEGKTKEKKPQKIKEKVTAPIVSSGGGFLGGLASTLMEFISIEWLVAGIIGVLSWVWEYVRESVFNAVKGNNFLSGLVSTIDRILTPISNFFNDLAGVVLGVFTGDTAKIKARLEDMLQDLADLTEGIIDPLLNIFNYAKTFLGGLAKAVWAALKDPFHAADAFSSSMSKTIKEANNNFVSAVPKGLMQTSTQRDLGVASPTGDMSSTKTKESGGFIGTISRGYDAVKEEALALKAGISSGLSGLSLANFLGQLKTETGFKSSEESGKYTYDRARTIFPKYAQQITNLQNQSNKKGSDFVDPRQLFNITYGGRMGNMANEGYKYRGRGLIQLTGKNNYIKYGNMLGIDLVNNPDLAADPEIAAKIAALYYKTSGAAEKAAKGDLAGARRSVQGGSLGLSESANYTSEYMAKLESGQLSFNDSPSRYNTAITPMVKPMMSVSTENIKPIPQDKTVQKQQSQILANISAQQTTTMDLSMDTLPHSELLMMRNMGKLT